MEFMKKPMNDRRKGNACNDNNRQAAIQRIASGKNFSYGCLRLCQWSHA